MMRRCGFQPTRNLIQKYCSSFCIQSTKLEMKMRALAAIKVIKFIASIEPLATTAWKPSMVVQSFGNIGISPQHSSFPLSQMIINHLKSGDFNFNESVINYFEAMVNPSKGIILPQHLNRQKRIKDAQNKLRKYAFFPNKIMTPLIFKLLLDFEDKHLLYGPAGTSKTSAISYFTQLASQVTSYEFEYDEVLGEESRYIPRIFYFSYTRDKARKKELLANLFASLLKYQCPKNVLQKCQNIDDPNKIMFILTTEFKKKNLKIKVVVDQFNTLVANCRKYNENLQDHKNKRYANQEQMMIAQSQLQGQKSFISQQIKLWIDLSTDLGQSVLYNSSVNIQNNILGHKEFSKMRLNLNHHSKITRIQIDYFRALRTKEGLYQLIHTICFQLLKYSSEYADAVEKIKLFLHKKQYVPKIQQQIGLIFLTPLQIREKLSEQKAVKILKQISQSEQIKIKQIISELLKEMHNNFITSLTQLSKAFHTSSQETGIKKLVFLSAYRALATQDQNEPKRSYSINEIKEAGVTFTIQEQFIDKNMFIYDPDSVEIELKFDTNLFLKATDFASQCLAQLLRENFEKHKHVLGKRNAIIGGLIEEKIVAFLTNYKSGLVFYDIQLPLRSTHSPAPKFLNFLKQQETIGLEERLKQVFAILEQKDEGTFAMPVVLKETGKKSNKITIEKPSENNPSFDILYLKKLGTKNWMIYTVDFTVSANETTITNKRLKFTGLIKGVMASYYVQPIKARTKPKITQWNHIIAADLSDKKSQFPPVSFYQKVLNPVSSKAVGRVLCNVQVADINRILPILISKENVIGQKDQALILGLLKLFKQN